MRAFVMAAGKGTRLRPLTDVLPKPSLPVANEPVLGRLLRDLAQHGIREIAANASYKADLLQAVIGDGTAYGVNLEWSVETELLGTAGGVKKMDAFLREGDDIFIVLSGDGLHDIDITAAVRAHRDKGALATIVLSRVDDPSEYGVAVLDARGFITGFQEKPAREDALSDLCNTGVYIFNTSVLDRIPAGEFYDFGDNLLPELVGEGAQVLGVVHDGVWNDIGGLDAYRESNLYLAAEAGLIVHGAATVHPSAELTAPVVIGAGATVGANARIASSVILPGAAVPEGAVLAAAVFGSTDGLLEWADDLRSELVAHS
jgi:NDP-sugar pyrophosphorylase family protein